MGSLTQALVTLLVGYGAGLGAFVLARRDPAVRGWFARADAAPRRAWDAFVVAAFLAYVVVFVTLALLRHAAFNTGLDLAFFNQGVWNAQAGNPFRSAIIDSVPSLNNYFDPILLAIVPLYTIVDDARTLLVLQTLALAVAAFPIYWYARGALGNLLAGTVALSFFLSPALQFVNLHQFHVIALSVPLLAFAIFFLLRERVVPFLVCTGLAWLVKEEVSLIVIGLGLYILLAQRKRWLGVGILIFGCVSLVVLLMYVVPWLTGKPYFVGRGQLGEYGSTLPEMVQTFFLRPDKTLAVLSVPYKAQFILDLTTPLGLMPLAGAEVLLTALPLLGSMLLASGVAVIQSQYPAALMPSLYFAAIVGLRRVLIWRGGANAGAELAARKIGLAAMVLGAALTSYVTLAPGPLGGRFDSAAYALNEHTAAGHALARQVPRDAVVVAQEELIPHFSNRREAYIFPSIPDYRQTEYWILEEGRFFYDFHKGRIDQWFATGYFEIVGEADGFIVAKRRAPAQPLAIRFGDDLMLTGYALQPSGIITGGATLRPILFWRAAQPIRERYAMRVEVVDAPGHIWAAAEREPHDGFSPTDGWRVGKTLGDQFALELPPTMPAGAYQVTLAVRRVGADDYVDARDQNARALGTDVLLATVRVEKNKASFTASQLKIEQPHIVDMQEMRLIGYVPPRATIQPGELLQVGVYWRARRKPQGDYVVAIQLREASGRVVSEEANRPAGGTYPTTEWSEGEVLLDWHAWRIPAALTPGTYTVHVVLRAAQGTVVLGETTLAPLAVIPSS